MAERHHYYNVEFVLKLGDWESNFFSNVGVKCEEVDNKMKMTLFVSSTSFLYKYVLCHIDSRISYNNFDVEILIKDDEHVTWGWSFINMSMIPFTIPNLICILFCKEMEGDRTHPSNFLSSDNLRSIFWQLSVDFTKTMTVYIDARGENVHYKLPVQIVLYPDGRKKILFPIHTGEEQFKIIYKLNDLIKNAGYETGLYEMHDTNIAHLMRSFIEYPMTKDEGAAKPKSQVWFGRFIHRIGMDMRRSEDALMTTSQALISTANEFQ